MKAKPALLLLGAIACCLAAAWPGIAFANDEVEIANWPAAPYWVRPASPPAAAEPGGRQALSTRAPLVVSPSALPFFALTPCRVADTRPGFGFSGQYGPPFMPGSGPRNFTIAGQCGVPANAQAVSFNFTVTNTAGAGFLLVYPQGGSPPNVSTLNYLASQTLANAAVVPLGTGGITAIPGVSGFDLIIDVNGYYAPAPSVTSLNTQTGDLSLVAGSNVTITPSGQTLTIASTAGSGGPPSGPAGGSLTGSYPNPGIASGQVVTSLNGLKDSLTLAGSNGLSTSASGGTMTVTSNATPNNIASTLVSRDGTGSLSAQSMTLAGTLALPATTASAGMLMLGGSPFLQAYGTENTFVGVSAGNTSMTGIANAAFGTRALTSNTKGGGNSAFGRLALSLNTEGFQNSAFGYNALYSNTLQANNSAFGASALFSNSLGYDNSAFGAFALTSNTAGRENAAFGSNALVSNTTGNDNSAFGIYALHANTTGVQNVAIGQNALFSNLGGGQNIGVGAGALSSNTAGIYNSALGTTSLYSNAGGSYNTAVGDITLHGLTAGNFNIALGHSAGSGLITGNHNIYLDAGAASAAESDTIRIGSAQTRSFLAGVRGVTTGAADGLAVVIDSNGQLGTASGSGGIITPAQLSAAGSSSGQALVSNGTAVSWGSPSFSLPYSGTVSASAAALQVGNTGSGPAVHGTASAFNAVEGVSTSSGNSGVYGQNDASGGYGIAGRANSGTGVFGASSGGYGVEGDSSASCCAGVYGTNSGGGYGVAGRMLGSGTAVLGDNPSPLGWAGYFNGRVNVVGALSKGGGSFKIDHPLDPENKYLYHSFVESPDMKNVYDGVAFLDAVGEARVDMPAWFDALNRDFRYQLTAIGAPQPNLHVRQEMTGNRFVIGGGRPGMKVSWQVTGIRQDAWANHNRIPVEEGKPEQERGRYLHPREHGHPDEDSVDWPRLEAMRSLRHPPQGN